MGERSDALALLLQVHTSILHHGALRDSRVSLRVGMHRRRCEPLPNGIT